MVRTRAAVAAVTEGAPHPRGNNSSGERENPVPPRQGGKVRNRLWPFGRSNTESAASSDTAAHSASEVHSPEDTRNGSQQFSWGKWAQNIHHERREKPDQSSAARSGEAAEPDEYVASRHAKPPAAAGGTDRNHRPLLMPRCNGGDAASAQSSGDGTVPFWTPRHSITSGGGNCLPASKGGNLSPEMYDYGDALSAQPSTAQSEDGSLLSDGGLTSDSERFEDATDERPATAPVCATPNRFSSASQGIRQQDSQPGATGRPVGAAAAVPREMRPSTAPSHAGSDSPSDSPAKSAAQSRAQALQRLKQRNAARRSIAGGALPPADILLQPVKPSHLAPGRVHVAATPGRAGNAPPEQAVQEVTRGRQPAPAQPEEDYVMVGALKPPLKPLGRAGIRAAKPARGQKVTSANVHRSSEELLAAMFEGARVRHLLHVTLAGLCRKVLDLQTFVDSLQQQQLEANPVSSGLLRQAKNSCLEARTRFAEIMRGNVTPTVGDRSQLLNFEYTGEEEAPQQQAGVPKPHAAKGSQQQQRAKVPQQQQQQQQEGGDLRQQLAQGSQQQQQQQESGDLRQQQAMVSLQQQQESGDLRQLQAKGSQQQQQQGGDPRLQQARGAQLQQHSSDPRLHLPREQQQQEAGDQRQQPAGGGRHWAPSLQLPLSQTSSHTGSDVAPTLEESHPNSPHSYICDSSEGQSLSGTRPGSPERPSDASLATTETSWGESPIESDEDDFVDASIEEPPAGASGTAGRDSHHARRAANLRRHSSIGFTTAAPVLEAAAPPAPQQRRATQGTLGVDGQGGAGARNNSRAGEGAEGKTFLKRRSQAFVSQKLDWSAVKPRTDCRLDANLTLPRKTPARRTSSVAVARPPPPRKLHAATGGGRSVGRSAGTPFRQGRPGALTPGSKRRPVRGVRVSPGSPIHKTRRRDWGSGVQLPDSCLTRQTSRHPTQASSASKQGPRSRNAAQHLPPRSRTGSNPSQVGHTSARAQAALDHLTASGSGEDGPLADLLEQVGDLLSDLNATQRELDARY